MRSPLCLLWIRDPKTKNMVWQVFRTANSTRGFAADAVMFLRPPQGLEQNTVLETLSHSAFHKEKQVIHFNEVPGWKEWQEYLTRLRLPIQSQ